MNITGSTKYISGGAIWSGTADGAFRGYASDNISITNVATSGTTPGYKFVFDASYGWTGATSEVGSSQSHNNMPPYLVAYC